MYLGTQPPPRQIYARQPHHICPLLRQEPALCTELNTKLRLLATQKCGDDEFPVFRLNHGRALNITPFQAYAVYNFNIAFQYSLLFWEKNGVNSEA
jgi:hypothetical protein